MFGRRRLFRRGILAGLMIFSLASVGADKARLTFDHFYDHEAVLEALQGMQKNYADLTELRSIGKSEEGRDIWLLTINNPKTGRDTDKPGVYVDGTIHGNEIQATEVCLYLADFLLNNYDSIPKVTELVDSCAFYIIPVVNVDSRTRFFEEATDYNRERSARVSYDDDKDGLYDEDPVEDLNGDGEISRMRAKDPFGEWKTHPDDPRVMVRVKPGEKGEWRLLGAEGLDNDGDGQLNEDGPGYLDLNRNYGFRWQPPYVQWGAGEFPMSGKATEAVAAFIISKPNICFNFAFHNAGGMLVRGPGSIMADVYSPFDDKVYDFLGREGEKIIPGYRYIIGYKDMYTTHGDFEEWMFSNLGIYGFVGELFMSSQERYRKPGEKPTAGQGEAAYFGGTPEAEKQKFNDIVNQGVMFKNWERFDHPQFGDIEIGGWRAFTTRIPPAFMLQEMVHRNASVIMFVADHTPRVELELLEVKDLGDNLYRVRVRAANNRALPTLSHNIVRNNILRPDIIRLEGNGIEIVSGGEVIDIHLDRIKSVKRRPWMIFTHVPSFGKRDIQWIVRGRGKATVTYDGLKAKNKSLKIDI